MSVGRIFSIAGNVVRETVREQVLYLTLLYSAIAVAATFLVPMFTYDSAGKIIVDVGIAAIEFVSLIVAVFVGTGLINKEIDKRTIFVLIAKPVSRAEFVLGKHLGISCVLALLTVLMTAIFIGIVSLNRIAIPIPAILTASFFIFWQLMLVAAIAILFGTFTSSLLAALLTFAAYLGGNVSHDLLQLGEVTKNVGVQNVTRFLYLLLPDLSRANLKNEAVYGILPNIFDLTTSGIYILSYALLVLAIAILIFANRQF